jgi:hypothetical protein
LARKEAPVTEAAGTADRWAPEFDGQRPPFTHANEAAVIHGARSERYVGPLAARIAQELLDDPDTPSHIGEPLFQASVQAWARAEAVCALLWAWLEDRDIMAGLTAAATTTEEEKSSRGKVNRKSVTRSVPSVLDTLRRYEAHAAQLRSKLGLDPASAARLGRDLAARRYMDATPLSAALAEMERRRALTAGSGDE